MKILVWCPFVNLGGGLRLLMQLVPGMARNPAVDHVRLVVPRSAITAHDLQAYQTDKLEIVALDSLDLQMWLTPQFQARGGFYRNRLLSALLRRVLPPYLDRVEAMQLWNHSRDVEVVYAFWPHGRPYHPAQAPIVCTYQDTTFLDFPEILGGAATDRERQRAEGWLRNAAHVVVSSQAVRERLVHHFGSLVADTTVIYHNISPRPDTPAVSSDNLMAAFPARYILYPANINPHNNYDMLLVAWSRFARRKEFPLVLTGEGTQVLKPTWDSRHTTYWQQDRLIGLVNRLGLKEGEDFFALGYLPDATLTTLMQRATALIMPSLSEGGGSYPVEEALRFGVPVICSDISVMREHVAQHNAEVVWLDPLSTDAILAAINELLDNFDRYKRSVEAAKMTPRPRWDDVAAEYIDVFQKVIADPRRERLV